MRRASYEVTPGDAYVFWPVRAREIVVDACFDCPWIDDLDLEPSPPYVLCSPPGYRPLRLPVQHATMDEIGSE